LINEVENPKGRNALMETNFNELLNEIAQEAFYAGRKFKCPPNN